MMLLLGDTTKGGQELLRSAVARFAPYHRLAAYDGGSKSGVSAHSPPQGSSIHDGGVRSPGARLSPSRNRSAVVRETRDPRGHRDGVRQKKRSPWSMTGPRGD